MKFQSLSPVLIVDEIEPCLPFWEALGFENAASVNNDAGSLQFVLLGRDGISVMFQTRASLEEDMTALEPRDRETSVLLYLNVDDLDAVEAALGDHPILIPRRQTFYGATEIGVREPGGNVVVFSTR